jgi:hypothetical protein
MGSVDGSRIPGGLADRRRMGGLPQEEKSAAAIIANVCGDSPSISNTCIRSPRSSFPINLNLPGASRRSTYSGLTSYRCLCLSQIGSSPPYSRRILHFSVPLSNTVGRRPSRIVPPRWVLEISGMKTIVGCGVLGKSSAECASEMQHGQKMSPSIWPEKLTFHSANVPCPFDAGHLEAKTDAQERHLFLSCPLDGGDHALGTTKTETAGYDDTPGKETRQRRIRRERDRTHFAEHTAPHASWYCTGSESSASGSRKDESTHCAGTQRSV